MSSYLYVLFFALLQKTKTKNSPSNIFCIIWLKKTKQTKKTTTVKYKMKYTKTTQCYPERKKQKQARV